MPKTNNFKSKDKDEINEEVSVVDETPVAEEEPEVEITEKIMIKDVKPVKKVFEQSDGVKCRSIVQGGLFMEGLKTQMIYSWTDYGDISEVEYRDLAAAVRSKSKFVYNPWIIIEDKDFLAEFPQIEKFYSSYYSVRELRQILDLDTNKMVAEIKGLPEGALESLKTIAAQRVANGQLDSISKIKALDKLFGTDLNLIGELASN